jgi:tRNA (mo5U34)-methyltransferase
MTLLQKFQGLFGGVARPVALAAGQAPLPERNIWGEGRLEPPTTSSKEELMAMTRSFPYWYQRIYLGQGVYTLAEPAYHERVWATFRPSFPDALHGASVLDVGTNAGYFALHTKLMGAGKVVGIESVPDYLEQAELCRQVWDADIEYLAIDAHEVADVHDPFDIVVFTGILYHLKNPLQVLEDVGRVCRDAILVETEVILPDPRNRVMVRQGPLGNLRITECHTGMMKFVEAYEVNSDGSNWWIPDTECVMGMLRTAGFQYFSPPCYLNETRLLLVASKKQDSILRLDLSQPP